VSAVIGGQNYFRFVDIYKKYFFILLIILFITNCVTTTYSMEDKVIGENNSIVEKKSHLKIHLI